VARQRGRATALLNTRFDRHVRKRYSACTTTSDAWTRGELGVTEVVALARNSASL
jgi:hypothetical protein